MVEAAEERAAAEKAAAEQEAAVEKDKEEEEAEAEEDEGREYTYGCSEPGGHTVAAAATLSRLQRPACPASRCVAALQPHSGRSVLYAHRTAPSSDSCAVHSKRCEETLFTPAGRHPPTRARPQG